MEDTITNKLYKKAVQARQKAYAPYSQFKVGAALITETGEIFTGCNIENSAYSLSICAERCAIFKAVSSGYNKFEVLLITADTAQPVTPCGACRQVIQEFGNNTKIIMSNLNRKFIETNIHELQPCSFKLNKGD